MSVKACFCLNAGAHLNCNIPIPPSAYSMHVACCAAGFMEFYKDDTDTISTGIHDTALNSIQSHFIPGCMLKRLKIKSDNIYCEERYLLLE